MQSQKASLEEVFLELIKEAESDGVDDSYELKADGEAEISTAETGNEDISDRGVEEGEEEQSE